MREPKIPGWAEKQTPTPFLYHKLTFGKSINGRLWGVWEARRISIMMESKNVKGLISFNQLCDAANKSSYYLLSSGKNVMELPMYSALGKSVVSSYREIYEKYETLLQNESVNKDIVDAVKKLNKGLLATIQIYNNGNAFSAYRTFKKTICSIISLLPVIPSIDEGVFYRMRSDTGLSDKKELWHIPFNMTYLSKSERFSIAGYPILYLGYSKRVCKLEISEGTLAKFVLHEPLYKILDLTLGQGEGKRFVLDEELMIVFPLIASCYVVPFYSVQQEQECKPKAVFFREEYIIPQFLTMYMKETKMANGIIYYSVKDPNLDVYGKGENDLRNIALYTSRGNRTTHDKVLMNKFEIEL